MTDDPRAVKAADSTMVYNLSHARALTIKQPWTAAITDLPERAAKRAENRTWSPARDRLPATLLIHRGQGVDRDAFAFAAELGVCLPTVTQPSGIVAVAVLDRVCGATVGQPWHLCDCGWWAIVGQYHWILRDVHTLPVPVPCKGRLRLWTPTPDQLAAVAAQLKETDRA